MRTEYDGEAFRDSNGKSIKAHTRIEVGLDEWIPKAKFEQLSKKARDFCNSQKVFSTTFGKLAELVAEVDEFDRESEAKRYCLLNGEGAAAATEEQGTARPTEAHDESGQNEDLQIIVSDAQEADEANWFDHAEETALLSNVTLPASNEDDEHDERRRASQCVGHASSSATPSKATLATPTQPDLDGSKSHASGKHKREHEDELPADDDPEAHHSTKKARSSET